VAGVKWYCTAKGYAATRAQTPISQRPRQLIYMHRLILGLTNGLQGDHIHGSGLDNRRSELRVATRSQNAANRRPMCGCASKYKGVTWHKGQSRWIARIKVDGQYAHLGSYLDERTAAEMYNCAALATFGEYACINELQGAR
jgi:hypothetical protein